MGMTSVSWRPSGRPGPEASGFFRTRTPFARHAHREGARAEAGRNDQRTTQRNPEDPTCPATAQLLRDFLFYCLFEK